MLDVVHVTKRYGDICSVRDVSFSIGEHEIVGLLGQNGAGKSTTMRMLAGCLAPTEGEICMLGKDTLAYPVEAKRQIGYLPEIPPLYMDMTVMEQLRFACAMHGVTKAEIAGECARVCEALRIAHVSRRVIGALSKGYRQRVGFAQALIGAPKLLILDEPTVGLDPQQMIDLRELIVQLSASMSVMISSHILAEIATVCSRILVLHHGALVADGAPEQIRAQVGGPAWLHVAVRGDTELAAATMRAAIGEQAIAGAQAEGNCVRFTLVSRDGLAEKVFAALAGHHDRLAIVEMSERAPSLEEVFIDITARASDAEKAGV